MNITARETRIEFPKRKEIVLKVALPEHCREIRELCTYRWGSCMRTWRDHVFHLVVGTYGPFMHVYWVSKTPIDNLDTSGNIRPPWMWAQVVGETHSTPFYEKLWVEPGFVHKEFGDDKYVSIAYHKPNSGSIWMTYIQADALEEILIRDQIEWNVVRTTNSVVARLQVKVLKPIFDLPEIYLNAHNQKTWAVVANHSADDWSEKIESFLGKDFPDRRAAFNAAALFMWKQGCSEEQIADMKLELSIF